MYTVDENPINSIFMYCISKCLGYSVIAIWEQIVRVEGEEYPVTKVR